MSKPETVPERIWTLWLHHRTTNFIWDECADAPQYIHPRPAVEQAIKSEDCKCVWASLDRRYDEGAVRIIFDAIQAATEGPAGSHALTPHAFRKKSGKQIARLARELRASMEELSAARTFMDYPPAFSGLPLEIAIGIATVIDEIVKERMMGKELSFQERYAVSGITDNLVPLLTALEQGALRWSATRPEITEKGSNPFRLHFIRCMTKTFRDTFNSPLREQVAALTRCIYACDMDAATVAKLAP